MDKFLFELVGPHYDLSRGEIKAVLNGLDFDYNILSEPEGLLFIESDMNPVQIGKRLGLTHGIYSDSIRTTEEDIININTGIQIPKGDTAVKTRRIKGKKADTEDIKIKLGKELSIEHDINLNDPDHVVYVFVTDDVYIGRKIFETDKDSFKKREVKERPHFSPISLKPRLARALVNLARPSPGDRLHDPFCGTGGILLEADLIDLVVSGGDISEEMTQGCLKNLEEFNVKGEVIQGDISETIPENIDCIVTDPPYGRSSSTSGEDIESIYRRLFKTSKDRLKEGGYLSTIFPKKEYGKLGKEYLKFIESFRTYVHGSLERYFFVYRKG